MVNTIDCIIFTAMEKTEITFNSDHGPGHLYDQKENMIHQTRNVAITI